MQTLSHKFSGNTVVPINLQKMFYEIKMLPSDGIAQYENVATPLGIRANNTTQSQISYIILFSSSR